MTEIPDFKCVTCHGDGFIRENLMCPRCAGTGMDSAAVRSLWHQAHTLIEAALREEKEGRPATAMRLRLEAETLEAQAESAERLYTCRWIAARNRRTEA